MPPKVKAPVERVYSSQKPQEQRAFRPRKTTIKSRHSLATEGLRLRQETLTQMPFVMTQKTADEMDREVSEFMEESSKPARKRRRTDGDTITKHYTQTLTQIDFVSPDTSFEFVEDESNKENSTPVRTKRVYGKSNFKISRPRPGTKVLEAAASPPKSDIGPPTTPTKKRILEIPSSRSPATPFSPGGDTPDRGILPHGESDAPPSPSPIRLPRSLRSPPPKLEIEDTFDSGSSQLHTQITTPPATIYSSPKFPLLPSSSVEHDFTQRSFPPKDSIADPRSSQSYTHALEPQLPLHSSSKTVRFAGQLATPISKTIAVPNEAPVQAPSTSKVIEDSDADSDDELETQYGESGINTQQAIEKAILSAEVEVRASEDLSSEDETASTPPSAPAIVASSKIAVKLPPLSTPSPAEVEAVSELPKNNTFTQFESQRLSTQHIDSMAPRSDRSDIFISLHPDKIPNILSRLKNHEFRAYPFPPQTVRLWIYETKPSSKVRYMASVSGPKQAGEIKNLQGLGNAEFNEGRGVSKYAYEILQVYELAEPVTLETLQQNHWLEKPPQKYSWVRPAVLDHLMANLMYPLFLDEATQTASQKSCSDSQAAEAQLQSTMMQFSDPDKPSSPADHMSTPIGSSESKFNEALNLLSTQQDSYREVAAPKGLGSGPRPSQATTVDLTQSPYRTQHIRESSPQLGEDVIAVPESPRQHLASSSPPASLPSSRAWQGPSIPFSLASSQILTRTQMLPDSLLNDSLMPPPPWDVIEDSGSED